MDIVDAENPAGVVVTFAPDPAETRQRTRAGRGAIMGTLPEAIDLAEDRKRFSAVLDELGITYPLPARPTRSTRRSWSPHA